MNWLFRQWLRQMATEKIRQEVAQAVQKELVAEQRPAGCESGGREPARCDVGVVFALAIEAGGLEDLLEDVVFIRGAGLAVRQGRLHGRPVVVVHSGPGASAAAKAAEATLQGHHPQWMISAGFAGALDPAVGRYDFVMAEQLVSLDGRVLGTDLKVDTASLAQTPGVRVGRLLSADHVVRDPAEKRALGEQHKALAVDMETFAVAEVCQRYGTPMLAVRIITDTAEERLPAEIRVLLEQKTVAAKLGAVWAAVWNRPAVAKQLWELKERALVASDRLARFLASMVGQLPKP